MIRSRDYFLFLVIVVFLLVGIGSTIARSYRTGMIFDTTVPLDFVVPTDDVAVEAVIPEDSVITRAERLAQLREKIRTYGLVNIAAPEEIPEPVATSATSVALSGELRCPSYQVYTGVWPTGVEQELVEGARVLFLPAEIPESSTATPTTTFTPTRTILAELPVRSASQNAQNCIPSDVIGITLGGALIKNDFAYAYAGWAEDALIGYALDGYPIYGVSQQATDACGGVVVGGEYRYQFSRDRETIINCFSGTPVQL